MKLGAGVARQLIFLKAKHMPLDYYLFTAGARRCDAHGAAAAAKHSEHKATHLVRFMAQVHVQARGADGKLAEWGNSTNCPESRSGPARSSAE